MGLDWCLKSKIQGKEPLEFIGAERCDPLNQRHRKICMEVIASHRKAIEIGNQTKEYNEAWSRADEEILQSMQGGILVDTVPKKYEQFLASRKSPLGMLAGAEAFRGKRVEYCKLLPEELQNAAYEDRYPDSMLEYADELELYIPTELLFHYDTEKVKADRLGWCESDSSIPDEFWDVHTLKEATAWLRFWAQHPIRLIAWY